ncbi:MAG: S-layer protein [Symbiobacteriaceae bacterium]|jgi:uncharacterized membrane protein YkoI|nr:S-layer protein [Symbiobacteriaceae bacterium]
MNLKRKRFMASLLVAALLTAPGAALAAEGPTAPAQEPVKTEAPVTKPALPVPDQKPTVPLAEVKVTREEAVALAAKAFPVPAEMGTPNVSLSQSNTYASWEVTWQTPSKLPNQRSMTVMVNAITGQIMNYYTNSAATEEAPLTYTRTEAYKLAAEWLGKLAPELKDGLRFVDNPLAYSYWGANASYSYHWTRMEQGYPVQNQGVDITIDARTGKLQNYSFNWDPEFKAELPKSILDKAQAEAAYRAQLPMRLTYRRYTKPGTDLGEWRLVYKPVTGYPALSQDGKLIGYNGEPIDFTAMADLKLVPATAKPYVKPAQPLTPDEALAMAYAITGRTEAPTNMNCREYGEEAKEHTCNFDWYSPDSPGGYLQIDLTTGLLVHMSNWAQYDPIPDPKKYEPKFSVTQAQKIAVEFLQKYRPDLAGKALIQPPSEEMMIRYKEMGEPIRSYNFQFLMTHEYIPVEGWQVGIEIDANTGDIRYFYGYNEMSANEKEPFPALTDLKKAEAAIDSFLTNQGLELVWQTQMPESYYMGKMPTVDAEKKSVTTLVWAPRAVMGIEAIDAKTGVPYDYEGRDLIEAAKRPTDIDGHYAQREIELLWARRIFDLKDGKFNPEQTISAAEAARWLVMAKGMQPYPMYDFAMSFAGAGKGAAAENLSKSEAAAYFGAALQSGILLPEDFAVDADPNAPVTREQYALWTVRALGYGDIAKMEAKIEMPFKDQAAIGAKFANAVALLNGLKISSGDAAGNFNPQAMVTRGEAAKILFAVASKSRMYWY